MAHGDAREGKWKGNWRMEWVASTLHTTSQHGVSSITTADARTSDASSRLNWRPHRFKWTRPFRQKKKSGFCACAITFQMQSTCHSVWMTVWYAGSSTHSDKYRVLHKHNCFSWWWAHSHPKRVQKRNKHTKKNCAPNWLYLQDYHPTLRAPKYTHSMDYFYLLHVSARHGSHVQGVFSVANVTPSKWPSHSKRVRSVTRMRSH